MTQPFEGFDTLKSEHPAAQLFYLYVPTPKNYGMGPPTWYRFTLHVNPTEFEGRPPETVLFIGGKGSSGDPFEKLIFMYCPEGWNTGYHEESKSWLRIAHVETNEPPYPLVDLAPLASDKVDVTKGYGKEFVMQHARKPGWEPGESWMPPSEFDSP